LQRTRLFSFKLTSRPATAAWLRELLAVGCISQRSLVKLIKSMSRRDVIATAAIECELQN
jgi:hypothetical protein